MEEKINNFDEKITYLRHFSKKNTVKMSNIKQELKLTIMKLKSEMNKKTIKQLKDELKDMKAQKYVLENEIREIKQNIKSLNDIYGAECAPENRIHIDYLFDSSDPIDKELFKAYFKDISKLSKEMQEQMKRANYSFDD